jgi:adenylate cyclase
VTAALPLTRLIAVRSGRWLVDARSPDPGELERFSSLPRVAGALSAASWTFAGPFVFFLFNGPAGYKIGTGGARQVVAVFMGLAYGALIGSLLTYLLSERELRPILSSALGTQPERWPPSMGVGARLILVWLAVAGAPLIILGYYSYGLPLFLPPADRSPIIVQIGLALMTSCLLTFVIGLSVFTFAGRAITAPIGRVREGLRRVAQGDLVVEVEVGEVGEIGLLQAGFNQMVRAMREREHVRDVFGRHVGTEIATRALETDSGLGGERCEVTALFVDVIGSTQLAESTDPTGVVSILNDFFDAVVRTVAGEGGIVNKFQGDGALCVFGAPVTQADHADRALRAARALTEALSVLDGIATVIGVSSGEVVAGNVGALNRYEFTVIGDPVNEASRLCDEAKAHPGHVLASGTTISRASDERSCWKPVGSITVRGRSKPTELFEPSAS